MDPQTHSIRLHDSEFVGGCLVTQVMPLVGNLDRDVSHAVGYRNWRVSRRGAEHVGCAQRGAARTQAKASTSRLKVACASSMCLSEW